MRNKSAASTASASATATATATTTATATAYAAPALDKGLDILEVLADAPQGLALHGIARATGRTSSAIFRMVATLLQRGYVAVDEHDRYSLTLKMLELSHRQQPLQSLVATASPLMRELAGRAYQSCHLSVYHDGQILVVAQVDAPGPFSMGAKVGALGKLTDSASGTMLLAFQDEAQRTRMIAAQIRIHGELDIDAAQLLRQIEDARTNATITWPSRRIRGATDVSRPVFGIRQEVIAALTVPCIERLDRRQNPTIADVETLVGEIAARLSELMCYTGHNTLQ